jgi:hypothetical protein
MFLIFSYFKDLASRIDLRDYCIVSIDPPGCTDIDDALHCRLLENGNLEVKEKEFFRNEIFGDFSVAFILLM